jgi:hypothetical protein
LTDEFRRIELQRRHPDQFPETDSQMTTRLARERVATLRDTG